MGPAAKLLFCYRPESFDSMPEPARNSRTLEIGTCCLRELMSLVKLKSDLRDLRLARELGLFIDPTQSFDVSGLVDPSEFSRPRIADKLIYFFYWAMSSNFCLLLCSPFFAVLTLASIGSF